MDALYRSYRMLLNNTSTEFVRYLHDQIEWDSRLIAILGARGIGKTTMLLQHIKLYDNIDETLFVTADDLYFTEHKLVDLAMDFYQHGGKNYILKATQPIVTSSVSDFSIGDYTFEIGGKNKTQKQVRDVDNAYIVKDDIEYGMRNIIPLWMFGFTY